MQVLACLREVVRLKSSRSMRSITLSLEAKLSSPKAILGVWFYSTYLKCLRLLCTSIGAYE